MMNRKRLLTVAGTLAAAVALYAALGFFLVPVLLKQQLSAHVEQKLKHQLVLGEVRFNPFTFALEATDAHLREASGGSLLAFKRLFVDFEAVSVFTKAWDFAEVTLETPLLTGELRKDGSTNFTALIDALRDPAAKPDEPPPPLRIGWIRLTGGRVDLADVQAGESARLRIEPIALELTAVSTIRGEKGPYKLTARTAERETLIWDGDLSLNPIASSGKLQLADWKLATFARLLGTRVAVEEPPGSLAASLEYAATYADGKPRLSLRGLDLSVTQFAVAPRGGSAPLVVAEKLALLDATFDSAARTFAVQRAELLNGRLALEVGEDGQASWRRLLASPAPEAASQPPADVPAAAAAAPWHVTLGELAVSAMALSFSDRAARTEVAYERMALKLGAAAELGAARSTIKIDAPQYTAGGIAIGVADDRIALDQAEFSARSATARLEDGAIEASLAEPAAIMSGLALRQVAREIAVEKLALRGSAVSARAQADGSRIEITGAAAESSGMTLRPAGATADAIALHATAAGAQSIVLHSGERFGAVVEALQGRLTRVAARHPQNGRELARLEQAQWSGLTLDAGGRRIDVGRLALGDARVAATIAADGRLDWDALLGALAGVPPRAAGAPKAARSAPLWKATVKDLELRNFAATFSDERQSPPLSVAVSGVAARASGIGTDPASSARIALKGRIKDGGELAADGRINLHARSADLAVKLGDLSLVALQPFVARHARLRIASAAASLQGRLRYGLRQSAGADLLFEGDVGLARVSIEETEPQQPFLDIDRLRASGMRLSLDPDRLDVPDLRLSGFSSKLVIAEDQSINIAKVLHPRPAADSTTPPGKPPSAREEPFPISVARIRIDGSRLEFADLSLRPQFGARMHELQGVITGVSTAPDTRAQAELDARVDEFGSARIRGEINLFKPRAYTSIDMDFRNIEMTALTPYTAKFAGYRIASGKLSMDLRYRIKDSALIGENKLVLEKLELGEKVESPTAFNLPLELAIAILKDSDGRIDIGLPVSGSLDDPQFSYGQLVWKAIGNLFARIVTAPFRALASLFGGGSERLEAIEFDPGKDHLLPPERQKLKTVAEALAKRPQLRLTVKPAYAVELDRAALQSQAVRRAITLESGVKLASGEDPGPIDYANPRTQRAIEALFVDRNSAAAARDLRAARKTAAAPPAGAGKTAADAPPSPAVEVARAMAQRLIEAQEVADAELAALAKRRGDAIAAELRDAGKIDSTRVETANPGATDGSAERSVASALELTVGK